MRFLLDTQVVVWMLDNPSKFKPDTIDILRNPAHQLFVSWISLWEIKIKATTGKLVYFDNTPQILESMNIRILSSDESLLDHYQIFDHKNTDPFDNAIIALAKQNRFTLLTSDRQILGLPASTIRTTDARK